MMNNNPYSWIIIVVAILLGILSVMFLPSFMCNYNYKCIENCNCNCKKKNKKEIIIKI